MLPSIPHPAIHTPPLTYCMQAPHPLWALKWQSKFAIPVTTTVAHCHRTSACWKLLLNPQTLLATTSNDAGLRSFRIRRKKRAKMSINGWHADNMLSGFVGLLPIAVASRIFLSDCFLHGPRNKLSGDLLIKVQQRFDIHVQCVKRPSKIKVCFKSRNMIVLCKLSLLWQPDLTAKLDSCYRSFQLTAMQEYNVNAGDLGCEFLDLTRRLLLK